MYRANVVQLESKISALLSESKATDACIAQAQLEELKFNRAKDTIRRQLKVIPHKSNSILKAGKQIKWAKMKDGVGSQLRDDNGVLVNAKQVVEKFYGNLYANKPTEEAIKLK